jgi:hypothetical protein
VPTTKPSCRSLSTEVTAVLNPADVSTDSQSLTPPQDGTGRVLPFCTFGSASANGTLSWPRRIGSIASCQMVAGLPPP